MNNRIPRVLFIDDHEAVARPGLQVQFSERPLEWRLLHPEEVEIEDVVRADLVIVDYFLNDWAERDSVRSASRAPRDGLAVIASLRSALLPPLGERSGASTPHPPVAFALWSANLDQAAFELPSYVLPHVFSRENNLEWAFRRNDLLTPKGVDQVESIANAVVSLAEVNWSDPMSALCTMLGLTRDRAWHYSAFNDVVNCRPPIRDLGPRTSGMSVVRWLLHRIFPYPAFLVSEVELASRFRMDSLDLSEDSPGSALLAEARYDGILANFDEPLWWRAGIEDWIWNELGDEASSATRVAELGVSLGGSSHREWRNPVPIVDSELRRLPRFAELADAVRVQPDDWPVYAEDAYALIDEADQSPELGSLVHPLDRHLLQRGDEHGT